MMGWTKTAVLAALLACAGAGGAQAQDGAESSRLGVRSILIVNQNRSGQSIWYAVYNSNKFGVFVGCVAAGQSALMASSVVTQVECAGIFYVRGEAKTNANCTGLTLRDSGIGAAIPLLERGRQTVVKLN